MKGARYFMVLTTTLRGLGVEGLRIGCKGEIRVVYAPTGNLQESQRLLERVSS